MDALVTYGPYILLGAFAGTLSGLLGVGGGVIVVPGCVFLFEHRGFPSQLIMHLAAGTSLASMVITTSCSLYAHYRHKGMVDAIIYYMIPGLVVGTSAGAVLAHFTHSQILKILFGLLMVTVALRDFLLRHESLNIKVRQSTAVVSSGATAVGVFSGLLGVGGGTLLIPFLEYCGIGIRQAAHIAIACGLVVAITGAMSFILTGFNLPDLPYGSFGYIYLPAFIGVAIGSPLFAFVGTKLHQHFHVSVLRKIFNVFLLIVGIKLLL
jgi:uncharacterized protein